MVMHESLEEQKLEEEAIIVHIEEPHWWFAYSCVIKRKNREPREENSVSEREEKQRMTWTLKTTRKIMAIVGITKTMVDVATKMVDVITAMADMDVRPPYPS